MSKWTVGLIATFDTSVQADSRQEAEAIALARIRKLFPAHLHHGIQVTLSHEETDK